ncbi:hypothetical protein [Photobacterium kishitanii]|uniref:Uncharacterized protein n=1 Tax=Photobacterium kishitanii TaxID=318456 RepID=A0A2T3KLI8_9GAMM|nr:hypothetical protein [Photobacterium kishitanii]PSV00584.1 hypothetical protein C9J27_05465 [Photobacterium kishitanii]
MADYSTYAELILTEVKNLEITDVIFASKDDKTYIVCLEDNPAFEKLLRIFSLRLDMLKTSVTKTFVKGSFWHQFGDNEHNPDEDFDIEELDWFNTVERHWIGTDEQYELYINDKHPSMYETVTYGSIKEEYPCFSEAIHTYKKEFKAIVFLDHWSGNPKAYSWVDTISINQDFSSLFFAKDAAKHFDFANIKNSKDFSWSEKLVSDAERFSERIGQDKAVVFTFG